MRQVNQIFQLFWGACLSVSTFGGIVPLVSYITNSNPPYTVAFSLWAPFDFEKNIFSFASVAIYQFVDVMTFCGLTVAIDLLTVFFFNAGTGLLEELSDKLAIVGEVWITRTMIKIT